MKPHFSYRIQEFDYLTVDGQALRARLYRPDGDGAPVPGVIDIHGGRWIKNDRYHNDRIAETLAGGGIAVLSIDFRMPPTATYPGSLLDINYAIRWFKTHAADFGVDADSIGGIGTSSGGHQLILAGMLPGAAPFGTHPLDGRGDIDASLKFMIAGWPVIDPVRRFAFAKKNGRDDLVAAHTAFWVPLSTMEDGNPPRLLDEGTFEDMPPLLIVQGSNDDNFDYRMVEEFAAAYNAKSGDAAFVLYDGEPHGFINNSPTSDASKDALKRMLAFVRDHTA